MTSGNEPDAQEQSEERSAETQRLYSAADIEVLSAIEAIRRRPVLYVGGRGPNALHILLYAAIDDALDRHLAGRIDRLEVSLIEKGGVHLRGLTTTVNDDLARRDAATLDQGLEQLAIGPASYACADGRSSFYLARTDSAQLAVANALSSRLIACIRADREQYRRLEYLSGVRVTEDMLPVLGSNDLYYALDFWPDRAAVGTDPFDLRRLRDRLRPMCYAMPDVRIEIIDTREHPDHREAWYQPEGIVAYVSALSADKGAASEPLVLKRRVILDEPAHFPPSNREASIEVAVQLTAAEGYWLAAHVNAGPLPRYARANFGVDDLLLAKIQALAHSHSHRSIKRGVCAVMSVWLHDLRIGWMSAGGRQDVDGPIADHVRAALSTVLTRL